MNDMLNDDRDKILRNLFECGLTEEEIRDLAKDGGGLLVVLINKDETILRVSRPLVDDKPGIFALTNKRFIFIMHIFNGAMSCDDVRHEDIVFLKHELNEKTGSLIIKTVKKNFVFEQLNPLNVFDIYLLIHELITNIIEESIVTPDPI